MKWLVLLPPLLSAQQTLTLADAVRTAQSGHPSAQAASARIDAASRRIEQARSAMLPTLNYQESYQRSNNPVFVFSTLLTQRRFVEDNFRVNALNNPGSIQNFQSVLTADQTLYDFGQSRRQVESARLAHELSGQDRRLLDLNLAATAARTYWAAQLAGEGLRTARESVTAAEADLKRAQAIRAAGLSTDAGVLTIQVHLAAMRELVVQRRVDLDVARAALNEILGAPLDTERQLATALQPLMTDVSAIDDLQKRAASERPDARQARIEIDLARKQSEIARTALYPRIAARAALEADRGNFVTQGGVNWFAGVTLKWNLFNGFADRSRIRESESMTRVSEAQQRQVASGLQLQVRKAHAEWLAANERIKTAEAVIAQAAESLRITRDRYEAGLATVTDLLQNETAHLETKLRRLVAIHDQRVAATNVELAAGTLGPESEVLK